MKEKTKSYLAGEELLFSVKKDDRYEGQVDFNKFSSKYGNCFAIPDQF